MQVSIARFNIIWTSYMESIFESEHPMDQIKAGYQTLTGKVATLCKQVIHVCEESEETKMKKARNLLNIFLSKRQQLFLFLQKNITSSGDFGWKSSFRVSFIIRNYVVFLITIVLNYSFFGEKTTTILKPDKVVHCKSSGTNTKLILKYPLKQRAP